TTGCGLPFTSGYLSRSARISVPPLRLSTTSSTSVRTWTFGALAAAASAASTGACAGVAPACTAPAALPVPADELAPAEPPDAVDAEDAELEPPVDAELPVEARGTLAPRPEPCAAR